MIKDDTNSFITKQRKERCGNTMTEAVADT